MWFSLKLFDFQHPGISKVRNVVGYVPSGGFSSPKQTRKNNNLGKCQNRQNRAGALRVNLSKTPALSAKNDVREFSTLSTLSSLSSLSRLSRQSDVSKCVPEPTSTRAGGQDDVSSQANSLKLFEDDSKKTVFRQGCHSLYKLTTCLNEDQFFETRTHRVGLMLVNVMYINCF